MTFDFSILQLNNTLINDSFNHNRPIRKNMKNADWSRYSDIISKALENKDQHNISEQGNISYIVNIIERAVMQPYQISSYLPNQPKNFAPNHGGTQIVLKL